MESSQSFSGFFRVVTFLLVLFFCLQFMLSSTQSEVTSIGGGPYGGPYGGCDPPCEACEVCNETTLTCEPDVCSECNFCDSNVPGGLCVPESDGSACIYNPPGECCAGACGPLCDRDGDGFRDINAACIPGDDCDDDDPSVNTGETEGPPDDPTCSDGKDNDCDTLTDLADIMDCCPPPRQLADTDGDGTKDVCCAADRVADLVQIYIACGNCQVGGPTNLTEGCFACKQGNLAGCTGSENACCNHICYDNAEATCCNTGACNTLICHDEGDGIETCCDKNVDGCFRGGTDDCCPPLGSCGAEWEGTQVFPPGPPGSFPHPNDPLPHWECLQPSNDQECFDCSPTDNGLANAAACGTGTHPVLGEYPKKCCFGECYDPQPLLAPPHEEGQLCCGDSCVPIICPRTRVCCQIWTPGQSGLGNWRCCPLGETCCGNDCCPPEECFGGVCVGPGMHSECVPYFQFGAHIWDECVAVPGIAPNVCSNWLDCNPPPTCFTGDTLITMADGSEKLIKDVCKGDVILSWGFEGNTPTLNVVVGTWEGPHDDLFFINGVVHVTGEHPFWTREVGWAAIDPAETFENHGWRPARLMVGQHLMDVDGKWVKLDSIKADTESGEVLTYNLMMAGVQNYFAAGVLVHNKNGVCFLANTSVLMADESEKFIQAVGVGDLILSWDFDSGGLEPARVLDTWAGPHHETYSINGVIDVTAEHPFWTREVGWASINPDKTLRRHGWSPAKLLVGYHLMDASGGLVEVSSIRLVEGDGEVMTYNLDHIEGFNNYFAAGVLVHNKNGGTPIPPTLDVPTLDVPTLDVPTLDVPTLDVPTLDVPTLDVPTLDVPTLDVPTLDVPTPDSTLDNTDTPDTNTPITNTLDVPTLDVPTPDSTLDNTDTPDTNTPITNTHGSRPPTFILPPDSPEYIDCCEFFGLKRLFYDTLGGVTKGWLHSPGVFVDENGFIGFYPNESGFVNYTTNESAKGLIDNRSGAICVDVKLRRDSNTLGDGLLFYERGDGGNYVNIVHQDLGDALGYEKSSHTLSDSLIINPLDWSDQSIHEIAVTWNNSAFDMSLWTDRVLRASSSGKLGVGVLDPFMYLGNSPGGLWGLDLVFQNFTVCGEKCIDLGSVNLSIDVANDTLQPWEWEASNPASFRDRVWTNPGDVVGKINDVLRHNCGGVCSDCFILGSDCYIPFVFRHEGTQGNLTVDDILFKYWVTYTVENVSYGERFRLSEGGNWTMDYVAEGPPQGVDSVSYLLPPDCSYRCLDIVYVSDLVLTGIDAYDAIDDAMLRLLTQRLDVKPADGVIDQLDINPKDTVPDLYFNANNMWFEGEDRLGVQTMWGPEVFKLIAWME